MGMKRTAGHNCSKKYENTNEYDIVKPQKFDKEDMMGMADAAKRSIDILVESAKDAADYVAIMAVLGAAHSMFCNKKEVAINANEVRRVMATLNKIKEKEKEKEKDREREDES